MCILYIFVAVGLIEVMLKFYSSGSWEILPIGYQLLLVCVLCFSDVMLITKVNK